MTKQPYNSDPMDQPDDKNNGYEAQIRENFRTNPVTAENMFTWVGILRAADGERLSRIAELNTEARNLGIQINLEDNPRIRMILEVKYDLVHQQINRLIDEHAKRPPNDLLRRKNISIPTYETETPADAAKYNRHN